MASCRALRPILFRVAEGDASPDEALAAARHLPTCTACRIVLARERRLAGLLEGLPDAVAVGDEFVGSVMEALPEGPPPVVSRRRTRRGLRVVGSAGVVAALALLTARLAPAGSGLAAPIARTWSELDRSGPWSDGAGAALQIVLAALERVVAVPMALPELGLLQAGTAVLVPLAAAALLGASTALFVAARGLIR